MSTKQWFYVQCIYLSDEENHKSAFLLRFLTFLTFWHHKSVTITVSSCVIFKFTLVWSHLWAWFLQAFEGTVPVTQLATFIWVPAIVVLLTQTVVQWHATFVVLSATVARVLHKCLESYNWLKLQTLWMVVAELLQADKSPTTVCNAFL